MSVSDELPKLHDSEAFVTVRSMKILIIKLFALNRYCIFNLIWDSTLTINMMVNGNHHWLHITKATFFPQCFSH